MRFRIKETRIKFGDTLQSLAEKINYNYSNLSKIERGVYTPTVDLLQKIATVYNVEICDLIVHSNVGSKKKIRYRGYGTFSILYFYFKRRRNFKRRTNVFNTNSKNYASNNQKHKKVKFGITFP